MYLVIAPLKQVAQKLVDAVICLSCDLECQATAFLYLDQSNTLSSVLTERNYLKLEMESSASLDLPDGNFDQYLQSLPSKRRKEVRREMRKFDDHGLTVSIQSLDEIPTNQLAELFHKVQSKYGQQGDIASSRASIERLKLISLPSLVYTAQRVNRDIVAFTLLFRYRNTLMARITGSTYDTPQNSFCYFNLAFYQPITTAIQQGIQHIHYGVAAIEAKVARGCNSVPMQGYFFIPSSKYDQILQKSAETITLARKQAQVALQKKYRHVVVPVWTT